MSGVGHFVWYHVNGNSFVWPVLLVNTLRPRQNRRHFADDIFKCIFLNENVWITVEISLKFVPKGPINNMATLVQKMAWCRPGDKPLSEPMLVSLPTHISVTRPQWVKIIVNWKKRAWLRCQTYKMWDMFGVFFVVFFFYEISKMQEISRLSGNGIQYAKAVLVPFDNLE